MKTRLATATVAAVALLAAGAAARAADSTKPRIAVLEFKNKADNQWWYHGGAEAAQDVFVTELVKSGRFRVVEREQLSALMSEKNLALDGDVDPATAVRAGKLLGVKYFLTGAVTEYGSQETGAHGAYHVGFSAGKKTFTAAMNARIIDTESGEIVWADEARGEDANFKMSIAGFGGGVDNDTRMFDKVMKPVIQQLTASIKAADL
jgi:curli biogenesis system outer membrane secretion channel CsgG